MEAVVVAFFTPAVDASAKEMLDYPPNDHRLNFVDGDSACLYEYLISHLCVAGSTVLDITSGNEKGTYGIFSIPCYELILHPYIYRANNRTQPLLWGGI